MANDIPAMLGSEEYECWSLERRARADNAETSMT